MKVGYSNVAAQQEHTVTTGKPAGNHQETTSHWYARRKPLGNHWETTGKPPGNHWDRPVRYPPPAGKPLGTQRATYSHPHTPHTFLALGRRLGCASRDLIGTPSGGGGSKMVCTTQNSLISVNAICSCDAFFGTVARGGLPVVLKVFTAAYLG